RLRARLAAGHYRADLAGAELFGEQDRGLLPFGRRRDDDRIDPTGALEPLQALGEQRPSAEAGERLRPVSAEPLAPTRGSENGPDHALSGRRDLRGRL